MDIRGSVVCYLRNTMVAGIYLRLKSEPFSNEEVNAVLWWMRTRWGSSFAAPYGNLLPFTPKGGIHATVHGLLKCTLALSRSSRDSFTLYPLFCAMFAWRGQQCNCCLSLMFDLPTVTSTFRSQGLESVWVHCCPRWFLLYLEELLRWLATLFGTSPDVIRLGTVVKCFLPAIQLLVILNEESRVNLPHRSIEIFTTTCSFLLPFPSPT